MAEMSFCRQETHRNNDFVQYTLYTLDTEKLALHIHTHNRMYFPLNHNGYIFSWCVKMCSYKLLKVMKNIKTVQPDLSVFIWHVPPVLGVARQMARWPRRTGLAASPEPRMGELAPPLSSMPQTHFSLLSSVLTACLLLNGVILLIQNNHLGFDYFNL